MGDNHMDDWRAWNGSSQMQPLSEKSFKIGVKKHKLLPHMKSIACQVCERIFITMNEVKETYSRPVNYFQR